MPCLGRITGSSAGQSVDHSHLLVFVHNAAQLGQRLSFSSSTKSRSPSTRPSCFRLYSLVVFHAGAPNPQPISQSVGGTRASVASVRPSASVRVRIRQSSVGRQGGRSSGAVSRTDRKKWTEDKCRMRQSSLPPSIPRAERVIGASTSNWGNKCTEWKHAA